MLIWILLTTVASALFIVGLCLFHNNVLYGPKKASASASRVERPGEARPLRS